jgi:hypothetical protein
MASFNKRASSRPLGRWDLTFIVEGQSGGRKQRCVKAPKKGPSIPVTSVYLVAPHASGKLFGPW